MYGKYRVSVVIPGAGHGKRMKSDVSKQYIEIDNKPILAITIEAFQQSKIVDEIILVVGESELGYVQKYIKEQYGYTKIHKIVSGGRERQDSVYAGLKSIDNQTDIVMVHDAVRPFITEDEIEKLVKGVITYEACVLGVKVKDTIKIINEEMYVTHTPDRTKLYAIQTPQAFHKELLLNAYKKGVESGFSATDDAMMVESFTKIPVRIIEGSYKNIKITTPEDLNIAKQMMKNQ